MAREPEERIEISSSVCVGGGGGWGGGLEEPLGNPRSQECRKLPGPSGDG